MSRHVETREGRRGFASGRGHIRRGYDAIQKGGSDSAFRRIDFGREKRSDVMSGSEPLSRDLDAEVGDRHADRDLVEADFERAVGADTHVGGEKQERTHGEPMTGAT